MSNNNNNNNNNNTTSAGAGANTSNFVFVQSKEYAWVPARLIESDNDKKTATVSIYKYKDEQSIMVGMDSSTSNNRNCIQETIQLSEYNGNHLPLQNINDGKIIIVNDMVDLPFLHEAAILYNIKARHIQYKPYTRTGDIIIAVNPYQWLHNLYTESLRCKYANTLVWNINTNNSDYTRSTLEPHVYETSSLAYRGLAIEGEDQSILVSGESGAGKTETVKILLSDIASVQRGIHGAIDDYTDTNDFSESNHNTNIKNNNIDTNNNTINSNTYQSPIVQRVLDSNPLLEAFGNAKTVRNDNSSRFGKYIQLQFDCEDPIQAAYLGKSLPSCILAGSKCEVYLLEKSRVVTHEDSERTYHIFYQLLSSDDDIKKLYWDKLINTDYESFTYVGYTDTDTIEGIADKERFQRTIASLELVGITGESLHTLIRALCIVLQLGNITFDTDPDDESRSIMTSQDEFNSLAELMGIVEQQDQLLSALTVRTMKARNEIFQVPLSSIQAKDSCDAFAKEIYAKTFLWLVRSINDATCAEKNYNNSNSNNKTTNFGTIGLLDIFGFESFDVNRFEQLCINYANEKLQQKFTQDIFRSVQLEYEYEGIELGEITYNDNTDVLDLIEGRMGLIAVLNEECVRPGGSDKGFVSKVTTMNKDNNSSNNNCSVFIREKHYTDIQFSIYHYAGQVIYNATNFVTKNMDTLPTDLQICATKSTNTILSNELTNDSMMNLIERTNSKTEARKVSKKVARNITSSSSLSTKRKGSNLVGQTVWTKFKNQLTTLMTNLQRTRSRYIRCIKPNTMKKPLIMQHSSTVEQLRCAGVVAAVTISRSAFPNRLEHDIVLDRFKAVWKIGEHLLAEKEEEKSTTDYEEKTIHLVEKMLSSALKNMEEVDVDSGKISKAFVMGKTRAYFRSGALEYLENERVKCLSRWAIEIQRCVRGYIIHTRYMKLHTRIIIVQSLIRMYSLRHIYTKQRYRTIIIQCWYRCIIAKHILVQLRRHYKATIIQAYQRRLVAMKEWNTLRTAVINIQKIVRGSIQRPKFRIELAQMKEEAKLENQVLALQRKLEEAERARIEAERKATEVRATAVAAKEGEVVRNEEKKDDNDKPTAAVRRGADSVASSLTNPDNEATAVVAPPPAIAAAQFTGGPLSQQQQTLMDESGKMLEYLRKEVFKLRSQNAQIRRDFDLLKDNNQRLMDANASAGASFAALNQHAKQLQRSNDKYSKDVQSYKQQVQKLNVTQVELKEELKMKQATYIAEVHSRLQYQKALSKIIDLAQERCRDDRLVEDFLRIADACEAEYMTGPTGLSQGSTSIFSTPSKTTSGTKKTNNNNNNNESSSGLMSSIRNLWS